MLCKIGLVLFLIRPVDAGLFSTVEDLSEAEKKGAQLSQELCVGTLYADSSDGKSCLDYASAFSFSATGSKTTTSILSCAHFLKTVKSRDPNCRIYYKDSWGKIHPVIDTLSQWTLGKDDCSENIVGNDVAIYQLRFPVTCNPNFTIPINPVISDPISLSTVSYGWALPLSDITSSRINTGPFYSCGTFCFDRRRNVLSSYFKPDCLLRLSLESHAYEQWFYGDSQTQTSQTFLHDSGAVWYRENQDKAGYELIGITSHSTAVDQRDISKSSSPKSRAQLRWGQTPYILDMYDFSSATVIPYGNFLTPLGDWAAWIQDVCTQSGDASV